MIFPIKNLVALKTLLVSFMIFASFLFSFSVFASTLKDSYDVGTPDGGNTTGEQYYSGIVFTAGSSYTLNEISIRAYRTNTGHTIDIDLTSVVDNKPDMTSVLSSGTIDGTTLTTDSAGDWYLSTLSSGVSISASTQYAIVVSCDTCNLGSDEYITVQLNDDSSGSNVAWQSSNSGSTWTAKGTNANYYFKTWESESSPSPSPSSTATSTDTFIDDERVYPFIFAMAIFIFLATFYIILKI